MVCFLLLNVIFSYWGCKMVQEEACAAEVTRKHNEEMTELLSLYYTCTRNTVRDLKEQASSNKGCINKTCKHTPHCLSFPHIHTHSVPPLSHTHSRSLTHSHMYSLSSSLSLKHTHSIFSTYPGWQLYTSLSRATWMEETGGGKPHVTHYETHTTYITLQS